MLTKEFKEAALKKLEQMTAEDFIKVFEKIGSQRTEKMDNLYLIIEKKIKKYGISNEFATYTIISEQNIKISNKNEVYSEESYALAA